jgi:SAM-dependent methyltransferase
MRSSEVQGELWGRAPATWSQEFESQMQPLFDGTLAALGALGGKRLLDAGCGTGLVASLADAGGASVSGLDASSAFVEFAGERTPRWLVSNGGSGGLVVACGGDGACFSLADTATCMTDPWSLAVS